MFKQLATMRRVHITINKVTISLIMLSSVYNMNAYFFVDAIDYDEQNKTSNLHAFKLFDIALKILYS